MELNINLQCTGVKNRLLLHFAIYNAFKENFQKKPNKPTPNKFGRLPNPSSNPY